MRVGFAHWRARQAATASGGWWWVFRSGLSSHRHLGPPAQLSHPHTLYRPPPLPDCHSVRVVPSSPHTPLVRRSGLYTAAYLTAIRQLCRSTETAHEKCGQVCAINIHLTMPGAPAGWRRIVKGDGVRAMKCPRLLTPPPRNSRELHLPPKHRGIASSLCRGKFSTVSLWYTPSLCASRQSVTLTASSRTHRYRAIPPHDRHRYYHYCHRYRYRHRYCYNAREETVGAGYCPSHIS